MYAHEKVIKKQGCYFTYQDDLNAKKHDKVDSTLTKREKDVLAYVIQGFTAKKIAQKLNLSPRTVETYTDFLKKKLNCERKGGILLSMIKKGELFQLDIID